jgi:hypothetical protein
MPCLADSLPRCIGDSMFLFHQVAEQRYFGRKYINQDRSVPPTALNPGRHLFRHAMQRVVPLRAKHPRNFYPYTAWRAFSIVPLFSTNMSARWAETKKPRQPSEGWWGDLLQVTLCQARCALSGSSLPERVHCRLL